MRSLDFIIIGAMKAGTTSICKYLAQHEKLHLPPEKEAPFFSEDMRFKKGYLDYFNIFFKSASASALIGKVTPIYMMHPEVPSRIKQICPDVKMIAILRDPIERAYSHYHMAVRLKKETRTFEEAILYQLYEKRLEKARTSCALWDN